MLLSIDSMTGLTDRQALIVDTRGHTHIIRFQSYKASGIEGFANCLRALVQRDLITFELAAFALRLLASI